MNKGICTGYRSPYEVLFVTPRFFFRFKTRHFSNHVASSGRKSWALVFDFQHYLVLPKNQLICPINSPIALGLLHFNIFAIESFFLFSDSQLSLGFQQISIFSFPPYSNSWSFSALHESSLCKKDRTLIFVEIILMLKFQWHGTIHVLHVYFNKRTTVFFEQDNITIRDVGFPLPQTTCSMINYSPMVRTNMQNWLRLRNSRIIPHWFLLIYSYFKISCYPGNFFESLLITYLTFLTFISTVQATWFTGLKLHC